MNFLDRHIAFKNLLAWPFVTTPASWSIGERGHVILIPGFASTWNFLKHIGDVINAQGYQVHPIKNLDPNVYPVARCLSEIKQYIQEKELDQVILLGHSKGGVIACLALTDSYLEKKVAKVVSIAAPFRGTDRARKFRWFFSLHELATNSKIVQLVSEINPKARKKIVNLYPRVDQLINPKSSQIFSGAKNVEIDVSGHTRILESDKTFTFLNELLRRQTFPKT